MATVAFIPARGGSKGVPGKNIRPFLGRPLIVHSIEQAAAAACVDAVYVSTDDRAIADISRAAGALIIDRPAAIAGDTATSESAIAHGIDAIRKSGVTVDRVVFLQATSPLRPAGAIDAALDTFIHGGFDSLLSVSPTHRFFWRVDGDTARAEYDYVNRPRRQDMKPSDVRYVENGSLYLFTRDHFERTGNRLGGRIGYVVFDEAFSLEIDSVTDFAVLETIGRSLLHKGQP